MRSRTFALTLLGMLLSSSAHAQQYGYHPYPGGAMPAAYADEPMADGEMPAEGYEVTPEGASLAPDDACAECGCEECDDCDCCGIAWRPQGVFANFEYNLWWTKGRTVPALATTSPAGTAQLSTGVLPGATVLFGDDRVGDQLGSGGTLTVGKWLDDYQSTAIVGKFRAFRADDGSFNGVSDGTSNLAVPFIDAQLGVENAYLVGFTPDGVTAFSSGSINVQDRLDLTMGEVYGQFLLYNEAGARIDMFGGYHTLRLDNSLSLQTNLTSLNGAFISPIGSEIFTQDIFEGRNEFHGGELGFMTTLYFDRWFLNMSGKMSVGNMRQTVLIDGTTVVTTPGPVVDVRDEGIFALGTNQGFQSRDRVAYIPEATLKLGYYVRPNVSLSLGYNFMYISSVVMGGDQLDRSVNLSQTNGGTLFGPARPEFLGFRDTDFWAQGINFGLEVTF